MPRQRHANRRPESRYLRPRATAGVARGASRAAFPVARILPAFVMLGMVGVVLFGGGFWSEGQTQPNTAEQGATETITIPPTEIPQDVPIPVTVPGGQTVLASLVTTDLTTTNYLTRPAITITAPRQRIDLVRVLRNQTLGDIAQEKGISTIALMWANNLNDASATLPVGMTIKVPPKDTMLHKVKETDTLESIARAYQVPVQDITNYPGNNVQSSTDLLTGSFLLIPTTKLPIRDRVIFYQVQPGDSFWKISQAYGLTKPTTLIWANNLSGLDTTLTAGQIIAVPPTDGIIHVTDDDDTKRTIDDAVTQIAKNFACAAIPCTDPPADQRVAQIRDAIFNFGPNGLTHGGRMVKGQEIMIPGGIPYVAPPPIIIPQNVTVDNPEPTRQPAPAPAPVPAVSGQAPAAAIAKPPTSAPAPARAPAPAPAPAAAPQPAAGFPGAFPAVYYPAQSYSCSGRNPGFVWPESGTITSTFGAHNGIDIATNAGTPLAAAQAGWVVFAGWTSDGLGNAVYIDHGNGFVTVYGHQQRIAVSVGQRVSRGQTIGYEGSTGNSTGPHVHFMVIDNGRSCNPLNYLP